MKGKLYYEGFKDETGLSISVENSINYPSHFHKNIELIYMLEDSMECTQNYKNYVVEENDILFVPQYHEHSYIANPKAKRLVLIIPSKFYVSYIGTFNQYMLPAILDDKQFNEQTILPLMKKLLDVKGEFDHDIITGYITVIVGELLTRYKEPLREDDQNDTFISEVFRYIDENCDEHLTLDKLARHFHYSKYYFSKKFKKILSISVNQYCNMVKVRKAISIYTESRFPKISDLAFMCGFNSIPSFYRYFKKIYGISPKQYFGLLSSGHSGNIIVRADASVANKVADKDE